MQIVILSTYELGRQPFSVASPTAWLREAGHTVRSFDLAIEMLDEDAVQTADLICFSVPMHTATRLALQLLPRVKDLNAKAHICFYGLYAPMNEVHLRSLGVGSVIGGEFEEALADLAVQLDSGLDPSPSPPIHLNRLQFRVPDRTALPNLDRYSYLTLADGSRRVTGYTESTRGCKHLCRHCPVVPVYGGQFRVVPVDVVIADIEQQVESGAEHITFGDPDFFNGPGHAVRVINELRSRWPALTYDVTIKIEHLRREDEKLPLLRETGCVLVTSAVESIDRGILEKLDKQHTYEDFAAVVSRFREVGLAFNPTFVTFTPWTTRQGYLDLLSAIADLGLVENVSPIQYAIRLLIPHGSRLMELEETRDLVEPYDQAALVYPWRHPDPAMDELHRQILSYAQTANEQRIPRRDIYEHVLALATAVANGKETQPSQGRRTRLLPRGTLVPFLSEPWYC